jgi:hypothetical protein
MIKPLIGLTVVLSGVLGVQSFLGQRNELAKARESLEAVQQAQASEPVQLLGFELDRGGDKKLETADLCGQEVVLLYLYSNEKRDATLEKNLALVAKENPKSVRVVPVRDAASTGPVPSELAKLGTPVTDAKGMVSKGYRVAELPAVVVLKSRPVYHTTLTSAGPAGADLEPAVDVLLAREDVVPIEGGGCGGSCGEGGGCMASAMIAQGGPGGCSH